MDVTDGIFIFSFFYFYFYFFAWFNKLFYFPCRASASDVSKWKRVEKSLEAEETTHDARLQLTTSKKGVIWLDQVSAMPVDTYKV